MTPRFALNTFVAAAVTLVMVPAIAQTSAQAAAAPGASSRQAFVVPPHNCVAPVYPSKETTMQLRGDAYNRAIEKFNGDVKTYGECIKKYVDESRVWLKEVADASNKAIEEYNKYNADLKEKIEEDKK